MGSNVLMPGVKLTLSASSASLQPGHGIALLMNVGGIDGASELELIPGHTLRKATTEEIVVLKEILVEYGAPIAGRYFFPWELEKKAAGLFDTAPEVDWKYFVVAFSGTNQGVHLLEQAFALHDSNLKIGFTTMNWRSSKTTALHAGRFFQALQENSLAIQADTIDEHLASVDTAQASQIGELARLFSEHVAADIDIQRVCRQLLNLQALDGHTDVAFLGYFSVLESLLVHKPDPKDPNDSITRQVKKKLTLLNNRWAPELDYSAFGSLKPEAVWVKMYEMRSAIAHGDAPDFKKDLKSLKDLATARSLLIKAVRAVARQALYEPRLVADLREC
jgi:Apea-like HEPN